MNLRTSAIFKNIKSKYNMKYLINFSANELSNVINSESFPVKHINKRYKYEQFAPKKLMHVKYGKV